MLAPLGTESEGAQGERVDDWWIDDGQRIEGHRTRQEWWWYGWTKEHRLNAQPSTERRTAHDFAHEKRNTQTRAQTQQAKQDQRRGETTSLSHHLDIDGEALSTVYSCQLQAADRAMIPPIVCSFEPYPPSQPEPIEPFEVSSAMHTGRLRFETGTHAFRTDGRAESKDEHIAFSGTEAAAVRWSAPNKQASKTAQAKFFDVCRTRFGPTEREREKIVLLLLLLLLQSE